MTTFFGIPRIYLSRPILKFTNEDELLSTIAATPTTAQLDQLYEVYHKNYEQRLAQSEFYQAWLWLFIGVVAIFAMFFGLRYRNRQRMQLLTDMNKTFLFIAISKPIG